MGARRADRLGLSRSSSSGWSAASRCRARSRSSAASAGDVGVAPVDARTTATGTSALRDQRGRVALFESRVLPRHAAAASQTLALPRKAELAGPGRTAGCSCELRRGLERPRRQRSPPGSLVALDLAAATRRPAHLEAGAGLRARAARVLRQAVADARPRCVRHDARQRARARLRLRRGRERRLDRAAARPARQRRRSTSSTPTSTASDAFLERRPAS